MSDAQPLSAAERRRQRVLAGGADRLAKITRVPGGRETYAEAAPVSAPSAEPAAAPPAPAAPPAADPSTSTAATAAPRARGAAAVLGEGRPVLPASPRVGGGGGGRGGGAAAPAATTSAGGRSGATAQAEALAPDQLWPAALAASAPARLAAAAALPFLLPVLRRVVEAEGALTSPASPPERTALTKAAALVAATALARPPLVLLLLVQWALATGAASALAARPRLGARWAAAATAGTGGPPKAGLATLVRGAAALAGGPGVGNALQRLSSAAAAAGAAADAVAVFLVSAGVAAVVAAGRRGAVSPVADVVAEAVGWQ